MRQRTVIDEISKEEYWGLTDEELSKILTKKKMRTTHGNIIDAAKVRAYRRRLPKHMGSQVKGVKVNPVEMPSALLDYLDNLDKVRPIKKVVINDIKTNSSFTRHFKKKYVKIVETLDLTPYYDKWLANLLEDAKTKIGRRVADEYGLSRSQFYTLIKEHGVNRAAHRKEKLQELGRSIEKDVERGFQYCDIKEKYGIDGIGVREACKSVDSDYGYIEAIKMRNKKIRKQYKEGKTYKDIMGQFCDITTPGPIYEITRKIPKRIKNYNQLEPKVLKIIEKGLKKGDSMTKIANKLNKKGYTRTDGREYTNVDINNIKVNYNGGEFRKYNTRPFGNKQDFTERNKKIFKLHTKKGLSYKEIGRRFDLTSGRVARIVQDLKK